MGLNLFPPFKIEWVTGLVDALAGKLSTTLLKLNLTDNSDLYIASQKAVKTAVDGKKNLDSSYTLANSLAGDYSSGSFAVATLSDAANKTISIANLTALRVHTFKIKNTHGSTEITITLPTAAGHNRSNTTFKIPAGYRRAVEVLYDGAEYWWTVGRLKTVTV